MAYSDKVVDHYNNPRNVGSFDKGDARDEAGNNHGVSGPGIETGKGRSGAALWFRRAPGAPAQVAGKGGKKAAKAAAATSASARTRRPTSSCARSRATASTT